MVKMERNTPKKEKPKTLEEIVLEQGRIIQEQGKLLEERSAQIEGLQFALDDLILNGMGGGL